MTMFTYQTKVRIDRKVLYDQISELKAQYDEIGNRDSHDGRSRFSKWNNLNKFYDRTFAGLFQNDFETITVTGQSKGATSRVYYKPSVTSLSKEIRKAIVPVNPDNVFVFFDLASAEFVLNAHFAGETKVTEPYLNGSDAYMQLAYMFPEGTPRDIVKTILIANMYNTTPYRVSQQLGISEDSAKVLLSDVARKNSKMTALKSKVVDFSLRNRGYYAPDVTTGELVRISDIDPAKGFNPDLALSCYTQSALGLIMQKFITACLPACNGTLLTVFDSVLIELEPHRIESYKEFSRSFFAKFRIECFGVGRSFWEAYIGS